MLKINMPFQKWPCPDQADRAIYLLFMKNRDYRFSILWVVRIR